MKGGLELFRDLIWDTIDPSMGIGDPSAYGDGRRGRAGGKAKASMRLSPQQGGLYLIPSFFSDGPGEYSDKAVQLLKKDPTKGGRKRAGGRAKAQKSKSKK